MSIMSRVIKTVFGDKSAKDRKLIWPIVEEINEFQKTLEFCMKPRSETPIRKQKRND